jgi:glycosyltransferase involved in cell wall biosynthesis
MKIWLIQIGEPLPLSKHTPRLLRTGIMANIFSQNGHEVFWWCSTFDHFSRQHVKNKFTELQVDKNYYLYLLHSISYKRSVSLKRLINHYHIARQFKHKAENYNKPDVILCSMPSIELCYEAVKYAQKNNVPIILDIRDMWPDLFIKRAPRFIRPLIKILTRVNAKQLKYACKNATSIIAVSQGYLDWAMTYRNKKKTNMDKFIPLAYPIQKPTAKELTAANQFWSEKISMNLKDRFVMCFIGSFSDHMEFETIINATKSLGNEFVLILAGTGTQYKKCTDLAKGNSNIILPGWINNAEVWTLLRMSNIGLAPYKSTEYYVINIPNKPIEYLSAGLPIVTCLKGYLSRLIEEHACGQIYQHNDINSLTTALLKLKENRELMINLSENAKKLFKENYMAEEVYSDTLLYLEKLIGLKEETASEF